MNNPMKLVRENEGQIRLALEDLQHRKDGTGNPRTDSMREPRWLRDENNWGDWDAWSKWDNISF